MVRDFRELLAWKLSSALHEEVCAFIATGPAARDFTFRDQISDASQSAPSNIAEGFGRFLPGEFAYFLRVARGSLFETLQHLHKAGRHGYLEPKQRDRLMNLARAAIRATTGLMLQKQREADERRSRKQRPRRPPAPS